MISIFMPNERSISNPEVRPKELLPTKEKYKAEYIKFIGKKSLPKKRFDKNLAHRDHALN